MTLKKHLSRIIQEPEVECFLIELYEINIESEHFPQKRYIGKSHGIPDFEEEKDEISFLINGINISSSCISSWYVTHGEGCAVINAFYYLSDKIDKKKYHKLEIYPLRKFKRQVIETGLKNMYFNYEN